MILYPNQKELTAGKWLGLSTWFRFLVLNILADLQELDDDWLFILCKCKCSDLFWSCFFFWNAQCQVWSLECTWEKNLYQFNVHQLSCVMSPGYYFGGMNTWGTDTSVSSCSRAAVVTSTKRHQQWEGWCFGYLYKFARSTKHLVNV